MKILVIGSQGMAGHMIVGYLRQAGYKIDTVARPQLDIEDTCAVVEFFDCLGYYDFVINCIGLLVQDSNNRPDRAAIINSWWPHYIEHRLKNTNTRLIHLSTDCVFDGANGPYTETSIHTEVTAYGSSKSLGEVNNNKDITFRMSIIGPELKPGTGLLNWTVNNPAQELQGWNNHWWNGITTLQLAKCIHRYIENPCVTGVYHLVNNRVKITKYNLLLIINRVYNLGKTIRLSAGPRPVNKVLVDTKQVIDWGIQDYQTQLEELRDFDPLAHVRPTTP
jgi:dTDP-4-dehydrorhamnose reductase